MYLTDSVILGSRRVTTTGSNSRPQRLQCTMGEFSSRGVAITLPATLLILSGFSDRGVIYAPSYVSTNPTASIDRKDADI